MGSTSVRETTERGSEYAAPQTVKYVMGGSPQWPFALVTDTLDLEKLVGWHYRAELKGFNVKKQEDCWLAVVKATKAGRSMVAFVSGRDYAECIENTIFHLTTQSMSWRDDKFA